MQSWLGDLEWARETTDPNDPQISRQRLEEKRRGIKPPPHPLIPPVAHRPPGIAQDRLNQYLAQLTERTGPQRVRSSVSRHEFDEALGLT